MQAETGYFFEKLAYYAQKMYNNAMTNWKASR